MSDFIFACPSCQGQISASSEHSGFEVECPLCHQKIVIPASPVGAPEPPHEKTKLHMAASTAEHKPQGFAPQQPPKKKRKKIDPALVVEIVAGIALVVGGILYGPKLYDKYKAKQAEKEAADQAASQPPPPPPEPSAAEIMHQLADKYKSFTSYSAEGKTTATLDMSELAPGNPAAKNISLTSDTAIRLGRPDLYRLEWSVQAGSSTIKGASWSAGKGNYIASGSPYPAKAKNRDAALAQTADTSGTLGMALACLFFNDNNPAGDGNNFAKTNGQTIGQDCYILAGDKNGLRLEFWVNKKTFLVAQTEVFLPAAFDADAYKAETNSAVKNHELRISRIHGSIIETYNNIAVNPALAAADFEKPASATAVMATDPMQNAPQSRRRGGAPQ